MSGDHYPTRTAPRTRQPHSLRGRGGQHRDGVQSSLSLKVWDWMRTGPGDILKDSVEDVPR